MTEISVIADYPVFVVAEIGGNHLGKKERMLKLIYAAANAGADAVKFQCFTPEQMVGDPIYKIQSGPWKGRYLFELYQDTYTPREWFSDMFALARNLGVIPFASVFHVDDVAFLESLDCQAYKISSFEINDLELIWKAAKTGKQVMISTGMSTLEEQGRAWQLAKRGGLVNVPPVMMKCTSAYPASFTDANLKAGMMYDPWGVSDHTPGSTVPVAAVALGARVVEKHLTLSRGDGGPDAIFSMEPDEFRSMADAAHITVHVLGDKTGPTESEKASQVLRRGLWWSQDLPKGSRIKREHIKVARPCLGYPANHLENLIGRILKDPAKKHTAIGEEYFDNSKIECEADLYQ